MFPPWQDLICLCCLYAFFAESGLCFRVFAFNVHHRGVGGGSMTYGPRCRTSSAFLHNASWVAPVAGSSFFNFFILLLRFTEFQDAECLDGHLQQ